MINSCLNTQLKATTDYTAFVFEQGTQTCDLPQLCHLHLEMETKYEEPRSACSCSKRWFRAELSLGVSV